MCGGGEPAKPCAEVWASGLWLWLPSCWGVALGVTGNSGVRWRPPSSHSHSELSTWLEVWAAVFQGRRLAHFQGVKRLPQWPWRSSGPRVIAVYQAPAHLAFVGHQGPHGRKTGNSRKQPCAGPQEKAARSCGRRAHWTVPQWDKAVCAPAQDCRRDGAIPSSSNTRRRSPRLFVGTYRRGRPSKKNRRMASVRFRLAMTCGPVSPAFQHPSPRVVTYCPVSPQIRL